MITVTLPDGSTKQVENGAPVKAVAEAISPRLADAAIVADVDGKLVDLTYPLTHDATVRIVTNKNPEAREVYRHSTAHLLAAAVTALFPNVQCGIGPPIDTGFAIRLRFDSRVVGPICLGYGSHFGLGRFAAE